MQTKDGLKRIDQISVNEIVLAKDLESGEEGWKQVEDRYLNTYAETVTVALKTTSGTEDKIVSNKIHPVNVKDKGWTKIGELKAGDQLLTSKGDWATVTSVSVEPKELTAFNLNVTGFDTFFIGDAGVWVKNCDLPTYEVSRSRTPEIAKNTEDAIAKGKPTELERVDRATRDANRRDALKDQTPAGPGKSLDEYPFASCKQGGAGACVREVPAAEQNTQGGDLGGFYRSNNIKPGDKFKVKVVE